MRSCQYWALRFWTSDTLPLFPSLANYYMLSFCIFIHVFQSVKQLLKRGYLMFWATVTFEIQSGWILSSHLSVSLSFAARPSLSESVRQITCSNPDLGGLLWVAAVCVKGNFCRHCTGLSDHYKPPSLSLCSHPPPARVVSWHAAKTNRQPARLLT